MNRKLTAIVSILALLTLACLVLVSNLIGGKKTVGSSALPLATPRPAVSPKAQAAQSPQPPAASKLNQAENQVQSQLANAQDQLGKISVAVSGNDWAGARSLFESFNYKRHRLPGPQLHHPDISPFLQDFFDLYSVNLEQSLNDQNSRQAQFAINQLFGIIGEQQARFGSRGLPLEVHRLRFLLREIELWNDSGNEQMVRVRLNALGDAWKEAGPLIRARRNSNSTIKELEAVMAKLSSSQSGQNISELTAELSKGLDQADKLFQRQPRAASGALTAERSADE